MGSKVPLKIASFKRVHGNRPPPVRGSMGRAASARRQAGTRSFSMVTELMRTSLTGRSWAPRGTGDLFDHVMTLDNFAEDVVFVVEPRGAWQRR